ncbi:zf-HC2 domain-containing protein [Streptomyces sp. NPDC059002]|uniref:zf-HC2 domain-containing protein n=1 Tax=Streptomyces sp. NPDC059002 TaxID=3346690 RepID=UPI00368B1A79
MTTGHDHDGHDRLRELLGPYVLGGLSPHDRAEINAHLRDCADCRDELSTYAPLPALLALADPADGTGEARESGERPTDALPTALHSLDRARRHRRRLLTASGVALAACTAGVGLWLGTSLAEPATSTPVARSIPLTAPNSPRPTADADLAARPWGTELRLDATQLPAGQHTVLVVTGRDGTRETAATWSTPPGGTVKVTGATALPPDQVTDIEIIGPAGQVLAEAHS